MVLPPLPARGCSVALFNRLFMDIYPYLVEYLLVNKILLLPRIGMFAVNHENASYNYLEKSLSAPVDKLVFTNQNNSVDDRSLFSFLSRQSGESIDTTRQQLEDYIQKAERALKEKEQFFLPGIGMLKSANGVYSLDAVFSPRSLFPDVKAEQVIRDNPSLKLKVGEDERTKTEMEAMLSPKAKKSYWWIYVLVSVIVLALVAGAYYYFYILKGQFKFQ